MAVPCPAAEAGSQPAQPEQRPGPAGVTVLGAARLRCGRVATFSACWQGWFGATLETKPRHKERLQPNHRSLGSKAMGGRGRWSFKGHLPGPSDTASEPMLARCHGQVPPSKRNDHGATRAQSCPLPSLLAQCSGKEGRRELQHGVGLASPSPPRAHPRAVFTCLCPSAE